MPKLLIVEDDGAMRDLLRDHLEDAYEIIETGDASEALALALQQKPDCVLLDLVMPKFSGFELCQTLASVSLTQLIPIFIISGEPAEKYKAFCQNLGAAEYFEKPLDFSRLKARLADVLKAKQPERRAEVRIRLRVALRLEGTDTSGAKFEVVATTEDVSAGGFFCGCPAQLEKDSLVKVFLSQEERYIGQARAVRSERRNTASPHYGFRFVQKPNRWILQ